MEKDKKIFCVGQILVLKEDIQVRKALSDTAQTIKKGTKLIVTANGMVMYEDGCMQCLGDDVEVSGYSTEGIASFVFQYLCRNLCGFTEMMEEFQDDITEEQVKENIADALEELGMYDHTGNRS